MKIGTYIRQAKYTNKGKIVYRYGIVLEVIKSNPKKLNVFWHSSYSDMILSNYEYMSFGEMVSNKYIPFSKPKPYMEEIKMELIEIISEV